MERDLLSAELELVPAFTVDDLGFDPSLIGGYGHDDRVCAYPALQAILSVSEPPEYTCITVLTDKGDRLRRQHRAELQLSEILY